MPDLIYNVKFNIDDNLQEGVAGAERYEQQVEELEIQVAELTAQLKRATDQQKEFGKGSKTTGATVGKTNKQLAIGNQLFFSLSDGIQDSAQFSQGFSTGMRAVGNNIGFTAELMGVFVAQTAAMNNGVVNFKNVTDGLKASFLGVGGLIFLLNTAITLFTVYGDEIANAIDPQRKFNKELEKQREELSKIAISYSTIASAIVEIKGLEEGFGGLNRAVEETVLISEDLAKVDEEIARLEGIKALQDEFRQLETLLARGVATEENEARYRELQKRQFELGISTNGLNSLYERQASLSIQLAEAQLRVSTALQESARAQEATKGIFPEFAEPFEFEFDLNTDQVSAGLANFIEDANKQMEEEFAEEQEALIEKGAKSRAKEAMNQIRLDQMVSRNKIALAQLASQATGDILRAAFGNSKGVQIATALIDTYVSAQKAFSSQLIVGDPTSLGRAQLAAGLAVASGLARVATIRSVTPDSTGGGGDGSGGATSALSTYGSGQRLPESRGLLRGSQMDTGRTPAFDGRGEGMAKQPIIINNYANVDSEGLYLTTEYGRKSYQQSAL